MHGTKERRKPKMKPEDCPDPLGIHALTKPLGNGHGDHPTRQPPNARRTALRPSSASPPFDEAYAARAKRATEDPPEVPRQATAGPDAIAIPIGRLVRHPDNREPTPEQIADMVRRIESDGQLEPIVVRELPIGHQHRRAQQRLAGCSEAINHATIPADGPCYQIVSGETRVLAQMRRGESKVVSREIKGCDDTQALKLLAEFNAGRHDLNPIQKAQLIKRLCDPVDAGGAGMTQQQAGAVYGLESRSGAANLIRLLELPKPLIELVESGKLPQTFARTALPYCEVPAIAAALPKVVISWKGEVPDRSEFEEQLSQLTNEHTRSMELANKWERTSEHNIPRCSDRLFEKFSTETRGELGIVKLAVWGSEQERAANIKLWEELQKHAREELLEKIKKKATKAASKDDKAAKRELTKAERKELESEQDEALAKRIRRWRHAWMRELIAQKLRQKVPDHWVLMKIVIWCLNDHRIRFDELTEQLTGGDYMDGLEELLTEKVCTPQSLLCLICDALIKEERQPDFPNWDFDLVEQLAIDLRLDLADAWSLQQSSGKEIDVMQRFYGLHNTRQLTSLAEQLGVRVKESTSKAGIIKLINTAPRILPFPKSIDPIGGGKKRRAK